MGETRNSSPAIRGDGFGCGHSDAVYIDTNRILDSCRDKDCFENVRVYLSDIGQEIGDRASSIRAKCSEVVDTCISVAPASMRSMSVCIFVWNLKHVSAERRNALTALLSLKNQ